MFHRPPHNAAALVWGLLTMALLAGILLYRYAYCSRPHEPVQPLPFTHSSHTAAEKANMDCRACHATAHHAAGAGRPASSTCLDCHRHILASDSRLLPLHAAANPDHPAHTGEPLRWVRRAPLPDTISFHHGQHAAAGHTCSECHPDPDKQLPHTMQSCLNCHRSRQLPTSCDRCHK